MECLTGCEQENEYKVSNSQGIQLFNAKEESGCFQRQCCGPTREFTMLLEDSRGKPVITMQRPGCRLAQPWICACIDGFWIFNLFDSCIQEITVRFIFLQSQQKKLDLFI